MGFGDPAWQRPWQRQRGRSGAPRLPPLAHPPALSMPASSRFPSYLNTALFLAAGNPSWADNTTLESDLKRKSPLLLFFFLPLADRRSLHLSIFPRRGPNSSWLLNIRHRPRPADPPGSLCSPSDDEARRKVKGCPINPDLAVLQGREAELARLGSGDGGRDAG